MNYATQMEAARRGILTEEMNAVAAKEKIPAAQLVSLMAEGKVIIPCNKRHKSLEPNGLGSMLKTKINVNLGTSRDMTDLEMEYEKVHRAVEMGGGGHYGSELLRGYPEVQKVPYGELSGHDRYGPHL